jgi:pantoate--beta-alanine ligase
LTTQIIRSLGDLRALIAQWRKAGERVGVVPTMGALHEGHVSLAHQARGECQRVIVTIFVNPRQFNNAEDLARYPRTEEADARLLAPANVDVVFVPDTGDVYPPGFSTTVSVAGIGQELEGEYRPGHFEGVATIVAKLFLMTQADRAYFGEKDYQQLLVVRRMARDLNMPIEVIGCQTVREADGLAMSSRNRRLDSVQRRIAPALNAAMREAARSIITGADAGVALAKARQAVFEAGFRDVEYVELRSADALAPMAKLDRPARLLAAAWLGDVRLIDNIAVDVGTAPRALS